MEVNLDDSSREIVVGHYGAGLQIQVLEMVEEKGRKGKRVVVEGGGERKKREKGDSGRLRKLVVNEF
ncbi:hypothetical protein VNO80_06663 [Phaseolus coccineus]|uniref:Uncharacterized protein n=1 Tax=Phaseolus coccineus TaxID=3886 RepID=A0AAN9RP18_PHACN